MPKQNQYVIRNKLERDGQNYYHGLNGNDFVWSGINSAECYNKNQIDEMHLFDNEEWIQIDESGNKIKV